MKFKIYIFIIFLEIVINLVIFGVFKFNSEIDFQIGKNGKKFKLEVLDVDEFFLVEFNFGEGYLLVFFF